MSVCEVKVILVYGQSWISRGAGCEKDARGQTCDEQLSQEIMKEGPVLAGLRSADLDWLDGLES